MSLRFLLQPDRIARLSVMLARRRLLVGGLLAAAWAAFVLVAMHGSGSERETGWIVGAGDEHSFIEVSTSENARPLREFEAAPPIDPSEMPYQFHAHRVIDRSAARVSDRLRIQISFERGVPTPESPGALLQVAAPALARVGITSEASIEQFEVDSFVRAIMLEGIGPFDGRISTWFPANKVLDRRWMIAATLLVATMAVGSLIAVGGTLRAYGARRDRCFGCGYRLVPDTCPECGEAAEEKRAFPPPWEGRRPDAGATP